MTFFKKKQTLILSVIFLFAVAIRLLYFPDNTYFGFDQARDAYAVKEILGGHLKIVGPPTANGIFHHGVLYYYIFAPFYLLSGGDPSVVSLFLRVLNAAGIFILYPLVLVLFGEAAAVAAAFLFAISYEQTQFALFLNHPSLAVISVLIFYLGLAYWIFKQKRQGFYLALFGLGLSIQFEFVEIQLIAVFLLFLLVFKQSTVKLKLKNILIGLLALLIPLASYIISEAAHKFVIIKQIPVLIPANSEVSGLLSNKFSNLLFILSRHFTDNLISNNILVVIMGLIFLITFIVLITKNIYKKELLFLALWLVGGLLVYFFINNDAYFYNTGTSIALLIFAAFLLSKLYNLNRWLVASIIILVSLSNIYLITKNNPLGPNQKINPQIGLLLNDEKKIVDVIYEQANGQEFAVNALTMPYNINTTWSYLFEWYGRKKYGYVPVWGGDAAVGFPGGLRVETARTKLPARRFLIIEPQEGIPSYLAKNFLQDETNYADTVGEKQIGTIKVLIQQAK